MNTSGAAHGAGSDSRWWMNALPPGIVAVKLADVTLDTATAPLTAVSQLTMAAKNGTGLVPRRLAGTAGSLASTRWSTSTVSCPLASRSPRMDRTAHGSGAAVTPRMAPAAPMNGETLAKAVSNWRTSRDDAPPSAASAVSGASATVASTVPPSASRTRTSLCMGDPLLLGQLWAPSRERIPWQHVGERSPQLSPRGPLGIPVRVTAGAAPRAPRAVGRAGYPASRGGGRPGRRDAGGDRRRTPGPPPRGRGRPPGRRQHAAALGPDHVRTAQRPGHVRASRPAADQRRARRHHRSADGRPRREPGHHPGLASGWRVVRGRRRRAGDRGHGRLVVPRLRHVRHRARSRRLPGRGRADASGAGPAARPPGGGRHGRGRGGGGGAGPPGPVPDAGVLT